MFKLKIEYNPHSYIPGLDNLRGLAVLSVMLFHCFNADIFKFGWMGVDLFFVLSGFLITGILLDSKSSPNYFRNFIVRRVLRIFPLYYFVLILCLLIIPPVFFGPSFEYYTSNQLWFWLYIQNWLYSKTGFPENHSLVHLWSLAIEEQFYLFWPFIVRIFNVKKLFIFSILIIVFSQFFRLYLGSELGLVYPYNYMATLSRMDALVVGAIIAILIRKRPLWLEKYTLPAFVISLLCFVSAVLITKSLLFKFLAPVYTFIDILCGSLLLLMLSTNKIPILRPLYSPIFSFLGRYSYGLYVYHYILYHIFKYNFEPRIEAIVGERNVVWVSGIFVIAISLFISVLSYKYMEYPFLKLKKYFSNSRSKK